MSITSVLGRLRARLEKKSGRVIEPKLARRVVCGLSGTKDDIAYVTMRPPASKTQIATLDRLCRDQFSIPVPKELAELYSEVNGIWPACATPRQAKRWKPNLRTRQYERAIRPIEDVIAALREVHEVRTEPDGMVFDIGYGMIVFVDCSDADWFAIDPWFKAVRGRRPVVSYDHELVNHDTPITLSESCEMIAPSLEQWLSQYIDSGLDVFLTPNEVYEAPEPAQRKRTEPVTAAAMTRQEARAEAAPLVPVEVHEARVIFVSTNMVLCKVEGLTFNPKLDGPAKVKRGDSVRIGLQGQRVQYLETTSRSGNVKRWTPR